MYSVQQRKVRGVFALADNLLTGLHSRHWIAEGWVDGQLTFEGNSPPIFLWCSERRCGYISGSEVSYYLHLVARCDEAFVQLFYKIHAGCIITIF